MMTKRKSKNNEKEEIIEKNIALSNEQVEQLILMFKQFLKDKQLNIPSFKEKLKYKDIVYAVSKNANERYFRVPTSEGGYFFYFDSFNELKETIEKNK